MIRFDPNEPELLFASTYHGGGNSETTCKRQEGTLVAVITRPCNGAKWFLHRVGKMTARGEPFPTKAKAQRAAKDWAKEPH